MTLNEIKHGAAWPFKSPAPAPLAVSIEEAIRMSGIGRTGIYGLLSDAKIKAVKHGTRTLVLVESLNHYLSNLPPATIRIQKRKAA